MAKEKNTRDMSLEELKSKLADMKESLFNLRFQRSLQQLEKPENISKAKKEIARIKTFIRQFELKIK
ncbi:MAG: 50S ribosomal protein L29 [Candidatus Marinimicrobia bacterium]|nr:50S ribosomal protein L29 [Candidatus Neomarinimicrobiota bacterium]|tara:strand:+ start:19803 stop:20003 length:201 start_codon:yes stop_codon:yes gene_type:complete